MSSKQPPPSLISPSLSVSLSLFSLSLSLRMRLHDTAARRPQGTLTVNSCSALNVAGRSSNAVRTACRRFSRLAANIVGSVHDRIRTCSVQRVSEGSCSWTVVRTFSASGSPSSHRRLLALSRLKDLRSERGTMLQPAPTGLCMRPLMYMLRQLTRSSMRVCVLMTPYFIF